MNYQIQIGQKKYSAKLKKSNESWLVSIGKKSFSFSPLRSTGSSTWNLIYKNNPYSLTTHTDNQQITFWHQGEKISASVHIPDEVTPSQIKTGKGQKKTRMTSSMPGLVKKIKVKPGDRVEKGQGLVVIEAMKMENEMVAPIKGKVQNIHVKENQTVEGNVLLLEIDPK